MFRVLSCFCLAQLVTIACFPYNGLDVAKLFLKFTETYRIRHAGMHDNLL